MAPRRPVIWTACVNATRFYICPCGLRWFSPALCSEDEYSVWKRSEFRRRVTVDEAYIS